MTLKVIQPAELKFINKPAQYLGGERGSVVKKDSEVNLHFCLAFPDTYEVGMSHLGMQILYDVINKIDDVWAERTYVPQPDMERLLRKKQLPLSSLEAQRPLNEFDIVGFSLQYELCMNGILGILDLGQIPLLAADRSEGDPIVIGGGPVCYHPEPFADFFDAFTIGDGEELVPELLKHIAQLKEQGAPRKEIIESLTVLEGVYVPKFFEPQYDQKNTFAGFTPKKAGHTKVRRRILSSLEGAPYPENPIIPNIRAVHDRLSIEVMRGCVRGCRFCQAGYLYRPQRERSPDDILKIVERSIENTGYEELSLLSLSTADYCSILPLLSSLKERFAKNDQLSISFPSTRVDSLKPELLQEVQPVRRSGFTIAPEAGTQRMRDVINKGVTEEQLMDTCRNVFKLGWHSIKMYFMIGLPTETDEDIEGIVDLARKVKAIAGHKNDLTVSVSTLVPKPHTPFQWAAQITEGETIRKQRYLYRELKKLRVTFRYHDAFSSFLEGVFARGDRQLGRVILRAYELGCRLDGWTEEVSNDLWLRAFEECNIDPHPYLHARDTEVTLPWDHISCDIPKRYFLKEWERAIADRLTPDCLTTSCSICGACDYDGMRNVLFDRARSEERLGIVQPAWAKIIAKREEGQTLNLLDESEVRTQKSEKTVNRREQSGGYQLKEYLQTETDLKQSSYKEQELIIVQKMRLKYTKMKTARFFAHLELATVFFRAARRAKIPVAFSKGFNPKPKFSFGPPLQLGLESEREFVDLALTEEMCPKELHQRINAELPDGLSVLEVNSIPIKQATIQASISAQRYEVTSNSAEQPVSELINVENWRSRSVLRKRKKKTREVVLGDSVTHMRLLKEKLEFEIPFDSQTPALKPLEIIGALTSSDLFAFDVRKVGVTIDNIKT